MFLAVIAVAFAAPAEEDKKKDDLQTAAGGFGYGGKRSNYL